MVKRSYDSDVVLLDHELVEVVRKFHFTKFSEYAFIFGRDYSKFKVSSLKDPISIRELNDLAMLETMVSLGLTVSDVTIDQILSKKSEVDLNSFIRAQDLYKFVSANNKDKKLSSFNIDFLPLLSGAIERFGIIEKIVAHIGQKKIVGLNRDVLITKALFDLYSCQHQGYETRHLFDKPKLKVFYPAFMKVERNQDYLLFNQFTSALGFAQLGKVTDCQRLFRDLAYPIVTQFTPEHKVRAVFIVAHSRRLFKADENTYDFICDAATGIPLTYAVCTTKPRGRTFIDTFVKENLPQVLKLYPDIKQVIVEGQLISNPLVGYIKSLGLNLICQLHINSPMYREHIHTDIDDMTPLINSHGIELGKGLHCEKIRPLPRRKHVPTEVVYDLDLSVLSIPDFETKDRDSLISQAIEEVQSTQELINTSKNFKSHIEARDFLENVLPKGLKYSKISYEIGEQPKFIQYDNNGDVNWKIKAKVICNEQLLNKRALTTTMFVVAQSDLDKPLAIEELYPLIVNYNKFHYRWREFLYNKLVLPDYYDHCKEAYQGFAFLSNVLLMTLIALGHYIEHYTDIMLTAQPIEDRFTKFPRQDGFTVSPYVTELAGLKGCLNNISVQKKTVNHGSLFPLFDNNQGITNYDLQLKPAFKSAIEVLSKLGPEWARFANGQILKDETFINTIKATSQVMPTMALQKKTPSQATTAGKNFRIDPLHSDSISDAVALALHLKD